MYGYRRRRGFLRNTGYGWGFALVVALFIYSKIHTNPRIVPAVVHGTIITVEVLFWVLSAWFVYRTVRRTMRRVAEAKRQRQYLRCGIREIDGMSGEQFEARMMFHFRKAGIKAQMTPTSNDYGADLICEGNGHKMVVQCKRYSNTVGISAVQEIIGAKTFYGADTAMVVTNNHLTKQAKLLAQKAGVIVWEREQLIRELSKDVA